MRLNTILRGIAPVIAMAAAAGVAGCNSGKVSFGDAEGVPLADLDMSGAPPEHVILMGSDAVLIHIGSAFAIDVEGSDEVRDKVRFVLKDNTLGVLREDTSWRGSDKAIVRVTIPAPVKLTIAGSGAMTADGLAQDAEIVIAGSGSLDASDIAVERLSLTIAGSGRTTIGGTAQSLDLTVAGSGDAQMGELKVGTADISIAGAGNATFASDGEVDASIMGAGNVTVRGSATCTVNAMGSGTLRCERGDTASEQPGAEPDDKAA